MKNVALVFLSVMFGASLMLNYIQYRQLNPNYWPPPTEACKETIRNYFRQQIAINLVFEFSQPTQTEIDDPDKPGHKIYGWLFEATWNFGPGSQSNFPMANQFLAQSDTVILHAPIGGQFKRWGVE